MRGRDNDEHAAPFSADWQQVEKVERMILWLQNSASETTVVWNASGCWFYLTIGAADPVLAIWASYNLTRSDGSKTVAFTRAVRTSGDGRNRSWLAKLGPFSTGDRIEYFAVAQFAQREICTSAYELCIGQPKPFAVNPEASTERGLHVARN
jgi:hypothetical protein